MKSYAEERYSSPEWIRFLSYAKRVRVIEDQLPGFHDRSPTQSEIQDVLDRKPPGSLLPNLHSIEWPSEFHTNILPLSFFFSPKITTLHCHFDNIDQLMQVQDNIRHHKPNLQRLLICSACFAGEIPLLKRLTTSILSLHNLTILNLGYSEPYVPHAIPITRQLLIFIPQLVHLHTFRIALGADMSKLLKIPSEVFVGFPSLRDLGISWENAQLTPMVFNLLNGVISPTLRSVDLSVPASITPVTMLDLTKSIAAYSSIREVSLCWKLLGVQNKRPQWNAATFLPPLFKLDGLQAISFGFFVFDWNETLCHDMATSWPRLRQFWVDQVNAGTFVDIKHLVYFAKKCPQLRTLSVPFKCTYENGDAIDAVYDGPPREQPLTIHNLGTYSKNDLATALYLYTLFGPFSFFPLPGANSGYLIRNAIQVVMKHRQEDGRIDKSALEFEKWEDENEDEDEDED